MVTTLGSLLLAAVFFCWTSFPLPDCFVSKPDCPRRGSPQACQVSAPAPEAATGCAAHCPAQREPEAGGPGLSESPRHGGVAPYAPQFLTEDGFPLPPVLPALAAWELLPPAGSSAAAGSWLPQVAVPPPIPVLLRTSVLRL